MKFEYVAQTNVCTNISHLRAEHSEYSHQDLVQLLFCYSSSLSLKLLDFFSRLYDPKF